MYSEIKEALEQISELDKSITVLNGEIHKLQRIKATIQKNLLNTNAEVDQLLYKVKN